MRTSDRRQAGSRAREAWLAVESVIGRVRDDVTITRAEIDRLLARVADAIDWADEVRLARSGQLFDCVGDVPDRADTLILESDAHDYREALARNDIAPARAIMQRHATVLERPIVEGSLDEQLIGRALLRLLSKKSDETAQKIEQEIYRYQHPSAADGQNLTAGPHLDGGLVHQDAISAKPPRLSDPFATVPLHDHLPVQAAELKLKVPAVRPCFNEAWTEVVEDLLQTKRWDAGKAAHAESSRRLWLSVVGDGPLDEIIRKSAVRFRRVLSQLPDTYHRDKRWRGLDVTDMVAAANAAEAASEPIARMSIKTVNRHISQLKQMWSHFALLDVVSKEQANPFDRLHMAVKKQQHVVREERDQFTIEEIKTLFAAPVWTGCWSEERRKKPGSLVIRDWKFWVPLIGAFSGMRREEICALKVADIEQTNEVWLVNLRKAKTRLKTPGSPRYVPIHETLLGIGILQGLVRGRSDDDWLFPDLTASALTNRRGEPFGKWFTPLRRELGIYRPEVVFHSFRHTVSTALHNAQGHHPFIEEIIGHESSDRQSELSRYTKETMVRNLKATIDLLDYGIDFSSLYVAHE